MSIASELGNKTPAPAVKKEVWTPPAPKVPSSAVTEQSTVSTPQVVDKGMKVEGPSGHSGYVKHLTDPSQKYPFLFQCSCQFEGRAKTQVDIDTTVQRHFERHE